MRIVVAVAILLILLVLGAVLDLLSDVKSKIESVAPWRGDEPRLPDPYAIVVTIMGFVAAAIVVYVLIRIATAIRSEE